MMVWALLLCAAVVIAFPFVAEMRRTPMNETARKNAPGRFADLSQGRTHFQWHGSRNGQNAICIHGLTTSSYVFAEVVPVLTHMGYRVLTYDLYGRGYSDRPSGDQNRGFFLKQLRELLDHEGVTDDLLVIGYSMGGGIATAFAASEWERVDRLVLIAPTGLVEREVSGPWTWTGIGEWLALGFGGHRERRNIRRENTTSDALPDLPARRIAETRTKGYILAVLSSVRHMIPDVMEAEHRMLRERFTATLAIWGENDAVIPARSAGNLADWNRDAHQVTVAGADHALLVTHPDAIREALQDFQKEI